MVSTDAPVASPVAPPNRRTSILPAAVVLGLAVLMLVLFGLMNMIGSTSTTPTTTPVILGGLRADPTAAARIFAGWAAGGVPPANVTAGLVAPEGARRVAVVRTGGGGPDSANYDLENRIVVDAPRARLLGFYRTTLEGKGWKLFSKSGNGPNATLLFQRAGTDGFYCEVGVTAAGTGAGTTYTFRLLQVGDYS